MEESSNLVNNSTNEQTPKKRGFLSVLFILIVLALVYFGWQYFSSINQPGAPGTEKTNYLISDVPYYGFYNLYFKTDYAPPIGAVSDVLGYWGDKRLTLGEQLAQLPANRKKPDGSYERTSILDLENFFRKNGYEASSAALNKPDEAVNEIKKYVNSDKKMPVIIAQKLVPEVLSEDEKRWGFRVVIGIFEDTKKILVHDYFFGNNYEISFDDFQKMLRGGTNALLAVWPSEKIKESLAIPQTFKYPARTQSMEKLGKLLATSGAMAWMKWYEKDYEKSSAFFKEVVGDQNFNLLPNAFQVTMLSTLALADVFINKYDEAIKIINEQALPKNQAIKVAPEEWFVSPIDKMAYPYFVLSLAYLKNNQSDLALETYREMVRLRDINNNIAKANNIKSSFPDLTIAELEKKISK